MGLTRLSYHLKCRLLLQLCKRRRRWQKTALSGSNGQHLMEEEHLFLHTMLRFSVPMTSSTAKNHVEPVQLRHHAFSRWKFYHKHLISSRKVILSKLEYLLRMKRAGVFPHQEILLELLSEDLTSCKFPNLLTRLKIP